jgi:precorrin-6Y C5,15-methyltransferase (decarboxylating)
VTVADRVLVIGVGPDGRPAIDVPTDTALLVGGRRHLDRFASDGVPTCVVGASLEPAVAAVRAASGTVVVLASGDPGWFGIVRRLAADLGPDRLEVHPAPSSVAAAFAAVGRSWEDAVVVSAHGRQPAAAIAAGLSAAKVAILTAPDRSPAWLCRTLLAAGCGSRTVVVASRLGHPDEAIHRTDLVGGADLDVADPNVVLLLDEARLDLGGSAPTIRAHGPLATPWARPSAAFDHRDGQVSKPEVRALALARLGAGPGRLLWDVGCGSGSVAIEAAGLGAGVVAVDRDVDQVARTRANAGAHGVSVGAVHGEAPAVLSALPDPDGVFVGGGGDGLAAVLDVVLDRTRDRIVVALATLERAGPVLDQIHAAGWRADGELIQAHELRPLAGGHRLQPRNPVLLVTGGRDT